MPQHHQQQQCRHEISHSTIILLQAQHTYALMCVCVCVCLPHPYPQPSSCGSYSTKTFAAGNLPAKCNQKATTNRTNANHPRTTAPPAHSSQPTRQETTTEPEEAQARAEEKRTCTDLSTLENVEVSTLASCCMCCSEGGCCP